MGGFKVKKYDKCIPTFRLGSKLTVLFIHYVSLFGVYSSSLIIEVNSLTILIYLSKWLSYNNTLS